MGRVLQRTRKTRYSTGGISSIQGFGLFLSREILAITGISIRETGTPGKGAVFELVVPPGSYRTAGKGE